MNKRICPACGSENISENKKSIAIKEPFVGEENIEIIENICHDCESTGDFYDQNDEIIEAKIKELKQRSVENILKYFIENRRSLTSIERALEIPFRTLAKWKNKTTKTSAAGIALLRFIRLFPWLLEVAENKYDPQKAENIMVNNAIDKLSEIMRNKKVVDIEEEKIDIGGAEISKNTMGTDNIGDSLNLLLEESFKKMQKNQYAKDSLVAKNTTTTDTIEVIEPVSAKDSFCSTEEKIDNCTI
jgi:transposase-like protein